jgi:hypothetical protein
VTGLRTGVAYVFFVWSGVSDETSFIELSDSTGIAAWDHDSEYFSLHPATCQAMPQVGLCDISVTNLGSDFVSISWHGVESCHYDLKYQLCEADWVTAAINITETSYKFVNLKTGSVYTFSVVAQDQLGQMITVKAVPLAPVTNFRITGMSWTSLKLAWDQSPGAACYRLLMKPESQSDYLVVSNSISETTAEVALLGGQYHTFCLHAGAHDSFESVGSVIIKGILLQVSDSIHVTALTASSAHIKFSAVPGATSYHIEQRTNGATEYTIVASNCKDLECDVNGLTVGVGYSVQVRAGFEGVYQADGARSVHAYIKLIHCNMRVFGHVMFHWQ